MTAVLVAAPAHPLRWLVAALDFDMVVDNDFQRRVQFGSFSEDADLAVIAAHGTLDTEAAAIDWNDPTDVLRDSENGTITVADAMADLAKWDRPGVGVDCRGPERVRLPLSARQTPRTRTGVLLPLKAPSA